MSPEEVRCRSPFCIVGADGLKGRVFEPAEDAQGLAKIWCPNCLQIGGQIRFFSRQTAEMVRGKYLAMRPDDLPKPARLILEQFAREIVNELGEEL